MTTINSLAPEILYDIASQFGDSERNRAEILRLRLLCRSFNSAVESLALSHLTIDVNLENYDKVVEKLQAYAIGATRATKHVKTVTIRSLALAERAPTSDFQHILAAALTELCAVHSLSWHTRFGDPPWAFTDISAFLARRHIFNFFISLNGGADRNLKFSRQTYSLRKLHIEKLAEFKSNLRAVAKQMATLIRNSPNLEELSIDPHFFVLQSGAFSPDSLRLHDFLPSDIRRPPLPLKALTLRCLRILLDETTLYHIRLLKSLSIHRNLVSSAEDNSESFSAIMRTLRVENIHLTELNVDITNVNDDLLDYLISYKGIKALVFDNKRDWFSSTSQRDSDMIAYRFFDSVLPAISGTLELLHLEAPNPGNWCFHLDNADVFGECTKLEELTVSIVDDSEDTKDCLEETAKKLPRLRHLTPVTFSYFLSIR